MEKGIRQLSEKFEQSFPPSKEENYSELTSSAVQIANVALCTFNGELLEKALAISRAIVDFEDACKETIK